MGKTSRALVGLLAGGLVLSLGLAFSGLGVQKEGEQTEQAAAPTAEEIKATVEAGCTSCHGADLKGSAGPSLYNLDQKYDLDEIATILRSGKGGMPGGLVPGIEDSVAEYLLTLK
ncbi:cytochrome c [Ammoniphilus sp. CFH 90114]|uniref:c-type cytochrome n=1 Tax=Ammoniphilus sp. CFH 90114 TaxID=2493665 RepID=UPI00100DFD1F|nr:cytochrome c [Ammoniphilus sp. CFH 90114]RXT14979.1 cytochrome c [Ammoniphilus sp. CFH 90114]